ncbi:alpha-mannosidase [Alicyclobacillus acidoterrestris]|uniref:alpha-mannosidase n=1 Tax=Alicyclobacillus suci TaxID=2816080 RepID=UPI001191E33F|nr:alpha-mannosidase [Alicyclobacillus suci]GEO27464.1 alpha-mannosidase [Alicyclobacillus acidoterrestris]
MFWTEEKLEARIRELSEYRYRDVIALTDMKCKEDEYGAVGQRPAEEGEWRPISVGDTWGGRDRYLWITASAAFPASWADRSLLGRFDFGKTGGGNNSGFESLLYVNGQPYQGVDANHQEVFFDKALAGLTAQLDFRLWSGLEGGGKPTPQKHTVKRAEIAWLDTDVDDLYYTAKAALETAQVLPEEHPDRTQLIEALEQAFRMIDWRVPGSGSFYMSVREARAGLRKGIAGISRHHAVTVTALGHTHIDVAWLWRLKHTREKAARSFSTVLRLMEKYPEYVFLQTQPQLYDYIKQDYPELYEQMKQRVNEGRWEAAGAMWLEADCNLTSGESLVRQILFGTRFFEREFGRKSTYLWLPDVFGYSWALPQILKKSGIDTFMTTKISWNQYNRMPHDTFVWRGMDGSEVLAHFITTPEIDNKKMWWYTYNGQITPYTVQGIWKRYRDKPVNRELLLSYGYGDGGGGVNREMLEMRRRLEDMPGLPKVQTGRADAYFERLHETVKGAETYVHTWDGELYLEYHRGTYTSQAYNKRKNRELELLYRETEWLSALGCALKQDWQSYACASLHAGWKIILRNQFHDIIPGSSIHEVYEDSREEYQKAEDIARCVWREAANGLVSSGTEDVYTIFNSAPWTASGLVRIKGAFAGGQFVDAKGKALTTQVIGGDVLVQVEDLPALGFATIRFVSSDGSESLPTPFARADNALTTPHYYIQWNQRGQLDRIYDIEADREVLKSGERGNVFQVFEDKPMMFDAWDIDIFYQEKMREVNDFLGAEVVEEGPLSIKVRFAWKYGQSTITQDLTAYADNRRLDFVTTVDWHEREQLLKVAFPVDIRATEATYDIQFGNVKRPTHWNTSWDQARFETVAHQWVDLSERGYGVSLLNNCKYGHDVKDNVMRLSLIKSATYPDVEADQGKHEFTYALLPHHGDWYEGGTVQAAWFLNNPLIYCEGSTGKDAFSLFQIPAPHVMVDAVKRAEDESKLVVRLHDFSGGRDVIQMTSGLCVKSWQECDLLERPIGEKTTTQRLTFSLNPYEIKTFLVEL